MEGLFDKIRPARKYIREWLGEQNVTGVPAFVEEESHSIDACAAALGAWHWKDPLVKPKWVFRAERPLHP
ncbi:hypothetical protein ACFFHM_12735 [Halalkalibacter kiskunsagensis]|uniref:Uncharacterized protein n=1 Tax=Halalkalibacter kiskunsagensis TaxID=1548599 RepID=A0ABV6KDE4_9BACI